MSSHGLESVLARLRIQFCGYHNQVGAHCCTLVRRSNLCYSPNCYCKSSAPAKNDGILIPRARPAWGPPSIPCSCHQFLAAAEPTSSTIPVFRSNSYSRNNRIFFFSQRLWPTTTTPVGTRTYIALVHGNRTIILWLHSVRMGMAINNAVKT